MKQLFILLSLVTSNSIFAQAITPQEFYEKMLAKKESLLDVRVGDQKVLKYDGKYSDETKNGKDCFVPEIITETVVYREGNEIHTHYRSEILANECNVEPDIYEEIMVTEMILPTLEDFQDVKKAIVLGNNKYLIVLETANKVEVSIPIDLNLTIDNMISECDILDEDDVKKAECSNSRNNEINHEALKSLHVFVEDKTTGDDIELDINYGKLTIEIEKLRLEDESKKIEDSSEKKSEKKVKEN